MQEHVIIAPHADDECIYCYEILITKKPIIIYTEPMSKERQQEALSLKNHVEIKAQFFLNNIPSHILNPDSIFYMPDPYFEKHFAHRAWGAIGESMARKGMNVIFYSLDAPYIHEVMNPGGKNELLDKVYPSQKSLWEWEKKYVLFEGYSKWIFK